MTTPIFLGFVGEVLLDVAVGVGTPASGSLIAATARLGGAPINAAVAAQLSADARVSPICSVGDDEIGHRIKSEMLGYGLCVESVRIAPGKTTSAGLYPIRDDGEESWSVYHRDADKQLPSPAEIQTILDRLDVIVFGAPSLADEECCRAVDALLRSKPKGCIVVFDANYRRSMWPDEESYRTAVSTMAEHVDVFKFNLLEASLYSGTRGSVDEIVGSVKGRPHQIAFTTLGARGCALVSQEGTYVSTVEQVTGSPIGAGDAFVGALALGLAVIGRRASPHPSPFALQILAAFANRCGRVAHFAAATCAPELKPLYEAEYATFRRAVEDLA
jgi:sugar/nucleoside kinase (ribokinase family)